MCACVCTERRETEKEYISLDVKNPESYASRIFFKIHILAKLEMNNH